MNNNENNNNNNNNTLTYIWGLCISACNGYTEDSGVILGFVFISDNNLLLFVYLSI